MTSSTRDALSSADPIDVEPQRRDRAQAARARATAERDMNRPPQRRHSTALDHASATHGAEHTQQEGQTR